MNINVNTNLYKVNSYKENTVNFLKVLDVAEIECHTFYIDKETAELINKYKGNRLIFSGFTYKSKKTGEYSLGLSSIKLEDGVTIYEYKKS